MVHYNISFDFTDPKNPHDINHMDTKDHCYENYKAWMKQIFQAAISGTWIISHLTIKTYTV
jgi:hypothetical protein